MRTARDPRLPAAMTLLAVSAALLYLPTLRHGFVFDDGMYIVGNPVVAKGFGWEGVRWAFTTLQLGYWQPLTWLSHMADVELFGMAPGPHHAASLLLHAANAALLMLVLVRMTGAFWRPALVAALFALHPLHVESVAWAAERKDVLAGLFWMLGLLAYVRYARKRGPAGLAAVAALFGLALMAKPMVVTLPLVLLLLDGWPLGEGGGGGGVTGMRSRLAEKTPLFALSAVGILLTLLGAVPSGALPSLQTLPLSSRLKNGAVSSVMYLLQTAWPSGLAVHYPLQPAGPPARAWVPALAVLVAVTALAWRERRRRPWLGFGWAWYLMTIFPVIGLVQLGFYARADRYTYLPLIGIFVAVVWGGGELLSRLRRSPMVAAAGSALLLALLAVVSHAQIEYWKDPVSLFGHALEVTEGNWLAHYGLCHALGTQGEFAAAEEHCRAAIALNPGYKEAHNDLGILLVARGDLEGALEQFREALRIEPGAAGVHFNLALTLERLGKADEARDSYRRAFELDPGYRDARAAPGGLGR